MRVGISGFQPERLTQIREARGLSKINLGRLVERSPSTITKWENGSHSPDAEVLHELSKILNCPVTWFTKVYSPQPEKNKKPVFFRTLSSTAKDLCKASEIYMEWLQELSSHFQEYVDYPDVNVPYLKVDDYRAIDDETIMKMAFECRKLWGLGIAPVDDLLLVMENAGIVCSRFEQGSSMMDGYSQWNELEGRPYVILASDKDNYFRSRFDAAHELGHVVLHRYINKLDSICFKPIEEQAHRFASYFIFPEEAFSVELPTYPTLENFLALKSRWGMSAQAMVFRANKSELISQMEYQRLYKSISARGWRKGEPLDDLRKPESVRLLPRCLNLLLDSGVFTKKSILETFNFSKGDLEDLCSVPKGFLSESSVLDFKSKVQLKNSLEQKQKAHEAQNVVSLFGEK
ncbi:TPA: helix-turn-helix domain-containing protein [Proteus mirabilis]|uniref:helix-turn-helix domain-containing protein n=1 Tax=Proteus mirabilis TaxID=584 RepID=UPI00050790CA|nr:ImmA/IrrE family metallo-endopeptidase [Proteus mirabilis]DAL41481.1 MAG TPA_asm: IrrE protein [Caudoviricetes sp.]AUT92108.1 ImmA/IrrE family metallo-endopeptidase [Proteus mirabilis]EKW0544704.1 ImmA/IrrE family metallo-endopeptidase [Proteus mirabilis]EKW4849859.1 ImmA/IrrE family metallo-endopeptidase [Proteus mirabilis]EKY0560094.1 ImmA/IrrE family metallo-endopeptidase [Proteus mirabilis]